MYIFVSHRSIFVCHLRLVYDSAGHENTQTQKKRKTWSRKWRFSEIKIISYFVSLGKIIWSFHFPFQLSAHRTAALIFFSCSMFIAHSLLVRLQFFRFSFNAKWTVSEISCHFSGLLLFSFFCRARCMLSRLNLQHHVIWSYSFASFFFLLFLILHSKSDSLLFCVFVWIFHWYFSRFIFRSFIFFI